MFAPERYRAKAAEYTARAKATDAPEEIREFEKRERALTTLANNEQWLADNRDKTVHALEHTVHAPKHEKADGVGLAADEEHILRCLGAALIMRWNTLPQKLQRELFDDAGTMGEVSNATALRGQIARFLHKHKDDEDEVAAAAS